jgi:hypothetical protein
MIGLTWSREFIRHKRGTIQIMVGRPRKKGYRAPSGRFSRADEEPPMRRLDGAMFEPTAIYVMDAPPLVKIGISINPHKRIRGLQTSNGQIVRLYWYRWMHGPDAKFLEQTIHRESKNTVGHAHGEWYYFSPAKAVDLILNNLRKLELYSIHEGHNQEVESYPLRVAS